MFMKRCFDYPLQFCFMGGLFGSLHHFQFIFGYGPFLGLATWGYGGEVVFVFERTKDVFGSGIVIAVADDGAIEADSIDQDVQVWVVCVMVPEHNILVLIKACRLQVVKSNLHHLVVGDGF